jgi:hypothetical protein
MRMQSPLSPAADMPPDWLWEAMCQLRTYAVAAKHCYSGNSSARASRVSLPRCLRSRYFMARRSVVCRSSGWQKTGRPFPAGSEPPSNLMSLMQRALWWQSGCRSGLNPIARQVRNDDVIERNGGDCVREVLHDERAPASRCRCAEADSPVRQRGTTDSRSPQSRSDACRSCRRGCALPLTD